MTLERTDVEGFFKSVSSSVLIENDKGELLLLKKMRGNLWTLPAGKMEPHEDPMMTAVREVKEEIGCNTDLTHLVGIYTIDRGDSATSVGFVFKGKIASEKIISDNKEIVSFGYFSISELYEIISENKLYKPEFNKSAIRDWINGKEYSLDVVDKIK